MKERKEKKRREKRYWYILLPVEAAFPCRRTSRLPRFSFSPPRHFVNTLLLPWGRIWIFALRRRRQWPLVQPETDPKLRRWTWPAHDGGFVRRPQAWRPVRVHAVLGFRGGPVASMARAAIHLGRIVPRQRLPLCYISRLRPGRRTLVVIVALTAHSRDLARLIPPRHPSHEKHNHYRSQGSTSEPGAHAYSNQAIAVEGSIRVGGSWSRDRCACAGRAGRVETGCGRRCCLKSRGCRYGWDVSLDGESIARSGSGESEHGGLGRTASCLLGGRFATVVCRVSIALSIALPHLNAV